MFIAIDGDNVGSELERYVLLNQVEQLRQFSDNFAQSMDWLISKLKQEFEMHLVFFGGDNLLAELSPNLFDISTLARVKAEFAIHAKRTLSIGIGNTPREAYFALKFAKTSGKNVIKTFMELSNA